MKIGFDLDDTLNDIRYTFLRILNRELYLNLTKEFIDKDKLFYIGDTLRSVGIVEEEHLCLWYRYIDELMTTNLPLPNAVNELKRLEREGHTIYYTSARSETYWSHSLNWLKNFGFPIHESRLFVGMPDLGKVDILKAYGVEVYFDDRPHIMDSVINAGIRGIIKDQCYNREWQGERIVDWSELEKFIGRKAVFTESPLP